jgi:hypothetical protein
MKKQPTDMGMNRTGIAVSPLDAQRLMECAELTNPPRGDENDLADVRKEYQAEAEPLGTMPPPASLKGAAKSMMKMLKGEKPSVLLDKLGERCAFERTGTRLYQTLVSRFEQFDDLPGGPTIDELTHFLGEEARHFDLLVDALKSLGADPTVMTPCADASAVASSGIIALLGDPRTSPTQCLHAILIAELADRDGWELLIQLASGMGQEAMARDFTRALLEEENHLVHVRRWLADMTLAEANARPAQLDDPLQLLREQRRRIHELLAQAAHDEGAVIELASALQDEVEQLEALGQEMIARRFAPETRM